MYHKSSQYLPKFIYFNLMMINGKQLKKNGRAKLDISMILNNNHALDECEIDLEKCTDKGAYLVINASMRS